MTRPGFDTLAGTIPSAKCWQDTGKAEAPSVSKVTFGTSQCILSGQAANDRAKFSVFLQAAGEDPFSSGSS